MEATVYGALTGAVAPPGRRRHSPRMDREGHRLDALAMMAAVIGIAAIVYLGPLMLDQLVLFSDQEQTRDAAVARDAMALPAGALLIASVAVLLRTTWLHGVLAALPAIVAVPLAWLAPDALFQLLAYGLTAPIAVGALLSAGAPLPRRLPQLVQLGAGAGLLALAVLGTPFVAVMTLVAGLLWWRLPRSSAST